MDLRHPIVESYENGEGAQAELAEAFGRSVSWVEELLRRRRERGSIATRLHDGGRARRVSRDKQKRPRAMVKATPDATVKASEGLMMGDVSNHHPEVIAAVQLIRAAA